MSKAVFVVVICLLNLGASSPLMEPDIQCTVVEVKQQQEFLKHKSFPRKFDTISNNKFESKLKIAGENYSGIKPKILESRQDFERILIQTKKKQLILELMGKPMNRVAQLKINNKLVAKATCH